MPKPRQVAVAVITNSTSLASEPQILLVASRKHDLKWVLPKGGIEEGENSEEAAEREAWEEAGLVLGSSMHLSHLITLPDAQPHKHSPSQDPTAADFIPSTIYSFEIFALPDASALADEWPEKSERERKWVSGWDELERQTAWGRRGALMKVAVASARARFS
ncbi:hypothetical protein RQP46_004674 [Phenoliferia psychrophenolica]